MLSKIAKEMARRLRNPPAYGVIALWGGSLFLWLLLFQNPWPDRLAMAYGSFLLWSISSGMIWDRKAPFLAVGFFLLGSWCLQDPDQQGWDTSSWLTPGHGLWVLLVVFSSLSGMMWMRARRAASQWAERQKHWETALLQVARMSSLGHRIRSICHELKNQIAVTTGYLDQLLDEKNLSSDQKRKIDRSLRASEKILKILTPLRMLAQETWDDPLMPAELNPVILDSLNFVERHIQFHSIVMNLDLGGNLPLIQVDAAQLHTIVVNLLYQSIATFKGQTIGNDQTKRIHITTDLHEGRLRLQYSDNAKRAKPLRSEQLFDLSHHLDGDTLQGGLELIVMQQLIRTLGGSLIMHEDEQGMTATVHLPQANAQPSVHADPSEDLLASSL